MNIDLKNLGTINKNIVNFTNDNGDYLAVWFSYKTPVGFSLNGKIVCRVNDWKKTTGKLLNQIEPNKNLRIDGATFEKLLNETYKEFVK